MEQSKLWYHKWNRGNNPAAWSIMHTLLKMDYLGMIELRIGQRFDFMSIIKPDRWKQNYD